MRIEPTQGQLVDLRGPIVDFLAERAAQRRQRRSGRQIGRRRGIIGIVWVAGFGNDMHGYSVGIHAS
jgi:hypothetical protein